MNEYRTTNAPLFDKWDKIKKESYFDKFFSGFKREIPTNFFSAFVALR